jgi:hypothetical protein
MTTQALAFAVVGLTSLLVALAPGPIVRLNLWLYRALGFARLAVTWEERLGGWIPVVRYSSAAVALIFLALGLGVLGSD